MLAHDTPAVGAEPFKFAIAVVHGVPVQLRAVRMAATVCVLKVPAN